jgi:hypothetical protein
VRRRFAGGFPLGHHIGKEALTPRTVLGELLLATVAVVADGRSAHEYLRAPVDPRDGLAQEPRAFDAAVPNTIFLRRRPSPRDRLAGEIDDGIDAVERLLIEHARCRIPEERIPTGRLGRSDELDDGMPARREPLRQR